MFKRKYRLLLIILLVFVMVMAMFVFIPRKFSIPMGPDGYARVQPATLLRSLRQEANCKIEYYSHGQETGTIVLWQDFFDGPMMLIPSTNMNILLCLYDYDVDIRLFHIDTSKQFTPLPPSSSINLILFTSTWEIQYATADDWQEVSKYLKTASPSDFARHRIPAGRYLFSSSRSAFLKSLNYANTIPQN